MDTWTMAMMRRHGPAVDRMIEESARRNLGEGGKLELAALNAAGFVKTALLALGHELPDELDVRIAEAVADVLAQAYPECTEAEDLYKKAVELVRAKGAVSVSFIQRDLQIGYNRAARLVERMEGDGVVSPADAKGRRTVLASA